MYSITTGQKAVNGKERLKGNLNSKTLKQKQNSLSPCNIEMACNISP